MSIHSGLKLDLLLISSISFIQLLPSELDDNRLMIQYGLITAANPLGQMVMPPIYGFITTKVGSIRMVSIVTAVIFVVANVLCAILTMFPEPARFGLFFLGRLLTGVASGERNKIICLLYTSPSPRD